jgi:cell division protein FtsB
MKKSPLAKYIIWSTVAFLVVILFFRHDNLIRWIGAGFTIHRQEKQIEQYKQEISELDKRIEEMSTNRDTLEKYARETFLFAEPGDDVYLTPDAK